MTQICGNGTCSQCQGTANCTIVPRKSCLAQRSEGYLTSLNPIHTTKEKKYRVPGSPSNHLEVGWHHCAFSQSNPSSAGFLQDPVPCPWIQCLHFLSDSFSPLNPNTFSFFRIRFRRSRERLADIEEAFRYKDRNAAGGALTLATLRAFAVRS